MPCTCPVCGLVSQYPEQYARKWHRCAGGCAGRTRMLIVPDGVGMTEDEVRQAWQDRVRRGRVGWALLALAGLLLVPAPLVMPALGLSLPWVALLVLTGVGATTAAKAAHLAATFETLPPAGL